MPEFSMDFELWWLFGFALFFGLGWLAARVDIKQLLWESRQLPRSYFKGLNFLLNEQPDKAIEAFIEVVKVDPETVELHFALGSLFRRRGERSEEHTSELQSLRHLVCRLLLEKKKNIIRLVLPDHDRG